MPKKPHNDPKLKIIKLPAKEYYNPASIIEDLPTIKGIEEMVLLYRDKNGLHRINSKMNNGEVIFMLEQAKVMLFNGE